MSTPVGNESRQQELRDQSTTDLVKQLADETKTLVKQELDLARSEVSRVGEGVVTLARQELQLAKAEMGEKGKKVGAGAGLMGLAGGIGLLAGGALTAFVILALDGVMPNWLVALLVGVAYGVVAAVLFYAGKNRVQGAGSIIPEKTVDSLKEDVQWAKTQIGSDSN
ncbi:MAG: phage holin family protein [Actinobacteria bacterium]|nr:phage holin family protein [Actinomycetota bacterium]